VTRRGFLTLLALAAAATAVSACGKKGRLKPPNPEKSTFPKQYPKPE
jgi:predicted small lipoprotein YifL